MFLRRNVASQTFTIPGSLRAVADGAAVTSATIAIQKDGTSAAGAGTLTHISGGAFSYTPTQGETDCQIMGYVLEGTGAVTICGSIRTTNADPNSATSLGLTNLDAAISTRSTYAGGDTSGTTTLLTRITSTRAGYLDNLSAGAVALEATAQAILTDTGTDIPATLTTIAGYLDTEVAAILAAVDTEVAAIKAKTDLIPDLTPTGTTSGSPTTTSITATGSDLSSSDDVYNTMFLVPTSGSLKGVPREITDYVGSTKTFTVDAFPAALASGVTFVVVGKKETA